MENETCVYCHAETSLYHNGHPLCLTCADLIEQGKPPRKPPASENNTADIATAKGRRHE